MRSSRPLSLVIPLVLAVTGCRERCPEEALPGLCHGDPASIGAPSGIADAVLLDLDGEESLIGVAYHPGTLVIVRGDGSVRSGPRLGDVLASAIEAGDFDGDGRADVVVLDRGAHSLVFFTVDPSARFTELDRIAVGDDPRDLWAGDLDDDGRAEVLVVDGEAGELLVVDGGDRSTRAVAAGAAPVAVAVGDVDNDGVLDVVAADFLGAFVVLRGRGDGTFDPATSITAGVGLTALAVGDVDGDGLVDIAGRAAAADELWLWRGGEGGSEGASIRTGGDLSFGDGLAIFAAEDGDGDGGIMLPVFSALRTWRLGGPTDPITGVLLGGEDLHASLRRVDDRWLSAGRDGAALLEAGEGPTFVERAWHPLASDILGADLLVGDFNGDGLVDCALAARVLPMSSSSAGPTVITHEVRVLLGDGEGGFIDGPTSEIEDLEYTAVDVDGDGRTDLVGVDVDNQLWVLRALGPDGGDEAFAAELAATLPRPARRLVALRQEQGVRLIAFTDDGETPGIDRIRLDPSGGVDEVITLADAITPTRVIAAVLGDDAGESLILVGTIAGAAVISGAHSGSDERLGPYHEIAALTGWAAEGLRVDVGAGALVDGGEGEVLLASAAGIARIRGLASGSPEVEISSVELDADALAAPGTILIADVDGDGERDLFRGGRVVDQWVRGDGGGLYGAAASVEVSRAQRVLLAPDDESAEVRALTLAQGALRTATLEILRTPRIGRRWRIPGYTGGLLIADLRGAGRPSPVLVGASGIAARIDPVADDHLVAWTTEGAVLRAATVIRGDGDPRERILVALGPRSTTYVPGPVDLGIVGWDGSRWTLEPAAAPAGLDAVKRLTGLDHCDVDGDGREDLIVGESSAVLGHLRILHARGLEGGLWGPLEEVGLGRGDTLRVGDVDRDGRCDLLSVSILGSTLFANLGDAGWAPRDLEGAAMILEPEGALLLLDGRTLSRVEFAGTTVGAPTVLADHVLLQTYTDFVAAGDLDGDGASDLVLRTTNGLTIWLARGGAFESVRYIPGYFNTAALADLDGGGRLDLISTNGNALEWIRGEGP